MNRTSGGPASGLSLLLSFAGEIPVHFKDSGNAGVHEWHGKAQLGGDTRLASGNI
jgi:hypothetical protein